MSIMIKQFPLGKQERVKLRKLGKCLTLCLD